MCQPAAPSRLKDQRPERRPAARPDGQILRLILLAILGFWGTPAAHAGVPSGVTVITHGYQPFTIYPDWVDSMAQSIAAREGGSVPIYKLTFYSLGGVLNVGLMQLLDSNDTDFDTAGAAILVVDWSNLASSFCNQEGFFRTSAVGDLVARALTTSQAQNVHAFAEVPIHLIGHSRGGSLMSEVAKQLALKGIWVDHLTYLDPHPFDCIGSTDDTPIDQVWNNVLFCDNYLQTIGGDGDITDFLFGYAVPQAYGVLLNGITTPGVNLGFENHSRVHAYYHGSIDLSAGTDGDGTNIDGDWYDTSITPSRRARNSTGFYWSRTGGGDRKSNPAKFGYHPSLGGTSTRNSAGSKAQGNCNVTFAPLSDFSYAVGDSIAFTYYYENSTGLPSVVQFSLDNNTNPFDSGDLSVGSEVIAPTQGIQAIQTSVIITGDIPPNDSDHPYFLRISSLTRHDYVLTPITVSAPPATQLAAPANLSPGADSEASAPEFSSATQTYSWNAVSNAAGYELNIRDYTTGQLQSISITGGTISTRVVNGHIPGHTYKWDMRAMPSAGYSASALTSDRYFKIAGSVTTPVALSPGNDAGPGSAVSSLRPPFAFTGIPGTTFYQVVVNDLNTGVVVINHASVSASATSYIPTLDLAAGHRYKWYLFAHSGSSVSNKSNELYFQVGAAPTFSIAGALPSATIGSFYSGTLSAVGGVAPYSWYLPEGSLPTGFGPISNSTGMVSGTPTIPGPYSFRARVTGANGLYSEANFSITVQSVGESGGRTIITQSPLPSGTTGSWYEATLQCTHLNWAGDWTLVSGALPAGLSLSSLLNFDGLIQGTPQSTGTSNFRVRVTDIGGIYAEKDFTLTIAATPQPPSFTNLEDLPYGRVGTPYSATLQAGGGILPYTFSWEGGSSLPAGLTLNPSTGMISGTPTSIFPSVYVGFRVIGGNGLSNVGARKIEIYPALLTPSITTESGLGHARVGFPFTRQFQAISGASPYNWIVQTGQLPPGLVLNPATGILSGTPQASGFYGFTLRCTGTDSAYADENFNLTIDSSSAEPGILAISPASGPLTGQTLVTITGVNFTPPLDVNFGGVPGVEVVSVNSTTLTVRTPPRSTYGTVPVIVTASGGTATSHNGFSYGTSSNFNMDLVGQWGGACMAVAVQSHYAYIGVASKLVVLDITNPANPTPMGSPLLLPGFIWDLAVNGSYVYAAASEAGLQVIDVSNPMVPLVVGHLQTGELMTGVTSLDGIVYTAGLSLSIIDAQTNPANPILKGTYPLGAVVYFQRTAISAISRPDGNFALVGFIGYPGGFHVIDVTDSTAPISRGTFLLPTSPFPFGNVSDLSIQEDIVYIAAFDKGLRAVDISNRDQPNAVWTYNGFVNDASVQPDGLVYADFSGSFFVIDASTQQLIGANSAIPGQSFRLAISGNRAFSARGIAGLQVISLTDSANPSIQGTYDAQISIVNHVAVAGNLAYLAANAQGMHVIDVSNPGAPALAGSALLDTNGGGYTPKYNRIAVSENRAYISQARLHIVDLTNPLNPVLSGSLPFSFTTSDVALLAGFPWVSGGPQSGQGAQQLARVNVSNPFTPTIEQTFDLAAGTVAGRVAVSGSVMAIADEEHGFRLVDTNTLQVIGGITDIDTPSAYGIAMTGSTVFLASADAGALLAYDISNPANPVQTLNYAPPSLLRDVAVDGSKLYLGGADLSRPIRVLEVSNISNPVLLASAPPAYIVEGITVSGDYVYAAESIGGLEIFRLRDTTPPEVSITFPTSEPSYSTSSPTMGIGGSAGDNTAVTQVVWANNRGGGGPTSGSPNAWTVGGIPLQIGENVVTVRAFDADGNSGSTALTVTRVGGTGRATGDFDDSGCTDITDFLFLLDYWQTISPFGGEAIGVSDFLNLLDYWRIGLTCS